MLKISVQYGKLKINVSVTKSAIATILLTLL